MCTTIKNYTSPKVHANYFFNWANSRINIEPNQSNINLILKNHVLFLPNPKLIWINNICMNFNVNIGCSLNCDCL